MIISAIVRREVKLARASLSELFLPLISSLITILIFLLVLEKYISDSSIFYGVVLIITTLNIFTIDSLSHDIDSGVMEQLFLLPVAQFKIILVKWFSLLLRNYLLNLPLWTIISHMLQVKFFYLQYSLFTIYITTLALLITAISLSLPEKKQFLSHILLLPIIFPQIILSILSTRDITYIYLSLALSIIMVTLFIVFATLILESVIKDS
jgi:ABC-type transport system involved in cytochrome c biogenesis permease component